MRTPFFIKPQVTLRPFVTALKYSTDKAPGGQLGLLAKRVDELRINKINIFIELVYNGCENTSLIDRKAIIALAF